MAKEGTHRYIQVVTFLKHPLSGESLIKSNFDEVLKSHHAIEDYAWIIHDQDHVSEDDLEKYKKRQNKLNQNDPIHSYYASKKVGDAIPAHIHLIVKFKSPRTKSFLRALIGVQEYVMRGGNGLKKQIQGCLKYYLHYKDSVKHQYDVSELHMGSDYLKNALEYELRVAFNETYAIEEAIQLIRKGYTLRQIRERYPGAFYIKNLGKFRDAYYDYILYEKEMPQHLVNVYIYGQSASGKSTLARSIARVLYPDDEMPYFNTGTDGVALQNYRGEPVIIWGDTTPEKLRKVAHGSDLYELLDTSGREKTARSVKFGSVVLLNSVNLFTSTENSDSFLDRLAGRRHDKQIYRRMQVIVQIGDDKVVIKLNKGEITKDSNDYCDYVDMATVRCCLGNTIRNYGEKDSYVLLNLIASGVKEVVFGIFDEYDKLGAKDPIEHFEILENVSVSYMNKGPFSDKLQIWEENFKNIYLRKRDDAGDYWLVRRWEDAQIAKYEAEEYNGPMSK